MSNLWKIVDRKFGKIYFFFTLYDIRKKKNSFNLSKPNNHLINWLLLIFQLYFFQLCFSYIVPWYWMFLFKQNIYHSDLQTIASSLWFLVRCVTKPIYNNIKHIYVILNESESL